MVNSQRKGTRVSGFFEYSASQGQLPVCLACANPLSCTLVKTFYVYHTFTCSKTGRGKRQNVSPQARKHYCKNKFILSGNSSGKNFRCMGERD